MLIAVIHNKKTVYISFKFTYRISKGVMRGGIIHFWKKVKGISCKIKENLNNKKGEAI